MTKRFAAVGYGAEMYTSIAAARGNTYTTNDDELYPTPLFFPENPFQDRVRSAKYILDIGCGVGRNVPAVLDTTDAIYIGIDPNPTMRSAFVELQKDTIASGRVHLFSDFTQVPDDVKFDFVICTFVFQHVGFRSPPDIMNVTDIAREIFTRSSHGAPWLMIDHEIEEVWYKRWFDENNIVPHTLIRNFTGIPKLTHRGPHDLIIFQTPEEFVTNPCDEEILLDFAEFNKESLESVKDKIANFKQLTVSEYNDLQDRFYRDTTSYVYDMLSANPSCMAREFVLNKFIPNLITKLTSVGATSFLDFGAGVGAVCSIMARRGGDNMKVYHADIPSMASQFAKYRYDKRNDVVTIIDITEDEFIFPSTYDIIYTDSVWEHLPHDKQISYLPKLVQYLSDGGVFVFLVDLSGEDVNMPMHYNVSIEKLHEILQQNGMSCRFGRNQFASVWIKE